MNWFNNGKLISQDELDTISSNLMNPADYGYTQFNWGNGGDAEFEAAINMDNMVKSMPSQGNNSGFGLGKAWDNLGGLDKFKVGLGGINTGLGIFNAIEQYGMNKYLKDYYDTQLRLPQEQNMLNSSIAADEMANKKKFKAYMEGTEYKPEEDYAYQQLANYGKTGKFA